MRLFVSRRLSSFRSHCLRTAIKETRRAGSSGCHLDYHKNGDWGVDVLRPHSWGHLRVQEQHRLPLAAVQTSRLSGSCVRRRSVATRSGRCTACGRGRAVALAPHLPISVQFGQARSMVRRRRIEPKAAPRHPLHCGISTVVCAPQSARVARWQSASL